MRRRTDLVEGLGQAGFLRPERIVDLGGVACGLGYVALALYSRGWAGPPDLTLFFALMAWVSVPLLLVFAHFHRRSESLPIKRLMFWAVAFRLCGLFAVPVFEDDFYRYLWDGYRFAETGTPYGWTPAESFADPAVPPVFQRILDGINYPDLPTIYGPTVQYVFLLSYLVVPGHLGPLQFLLAGFDLLLIRMLLTAARPSFVLLYAWCPLVIKEIVFTAHPDGLGVCLLMAAVLLRRGRRENSAAVCLALAVGAKVFALALAPFVLARAGPRAWGLFAAVLGALYLPFVAQGSTDWAALAVFASAWEFNPALYGLLTPWLSPLTAKLALGAGLLAFTGSYWLRYRRGSPGSIPRGDWVFGAGLLVSPVVNPWYALWILPFAVVYPSRWAWTASWALLLAYATALHTGASGLDPFAQPAWVRPLEFGAILTALGIDLWRGAEARGSRLRAG